VAVPSPLYMRYSSIFYFITAFVFKVVPKIMLNYSPNKRERLGRPLKGLLDGAETGLSRLYS
jgi:hypothetical protein